MKTQPQPISVWSKAFGEEIVRLAQGQKGAVEGTDALFFINIADVSMDRKRTSHMQGSVQTIDRRSRILIESGSH